MKKKLFSVVMFLFMMFFVTNVASAATTTDIHHSKQYLLVMLSLFHVDQTDSQIIINALNWPDYVASTQSTDITNPVTQQATVPIQQSIASVPESANFSISTTDKGTYVVFQENNADNVTMQGIVYKMPSSGYVNDASGQLYECGDVLSSWANYPYPCPTTNGNYETKSYQDNFGRSTPFDLLSGVTMPEGTTIYYYKAVDSSGKLYEYTAS